MSLQIVSVDVTQPTNGLRNGHLTNAIVTGGTTPYSYQWSAVQGTQNAFFYTDARGDASGLNASTYYLDITDAASATVRGTYVLTNVNTPPLSITPGTITEAASSSAADGAISATTVTGGSAPLTYAWSSSSPGYTVITDTTAGAKMNLKAATYRLTVTDSTSATAFHDYVVKVQTLTGLTIVPGSMQFYAHDGHYYADIGDSTVTGGTQPYHATWTGTDGASTIADTLLTGHKGLVPGQYTLTVVDSDANGGVATFLVPKHKKLYYHRGSGWSAKKPSSG
jgi:hypothetical protein